MEPRVGSPSTGIGLEGADVKNLAGVLFLFSALTLTLEGR